MTFLRALRLLILGETWTLPAGVLATLAGGAALHELVPGLWESAGGLLLLAGVVAVLAGGTRQRRVPPKRAVRSRRHPQG